jgi:arsenical pump membrane protein
MTAASILALTVGLSLARPRLAGRRMQPQWAAVLGALLTIGLGLLTLPEAYHAVGTLLSPLFTIVSLMVSTLVAEQAGLFRHVGYHVARLSRGDGRLLFRNLFLAGTITGAVFTNDAAVLIYTPLVFALVEESASPEWRLRQRLPYYFAVLYVANLVGPLVISNPINIIVADWFDIGFLEYAAWMALPALASIGVTYAGVGAFFSRSIPPSFRLADGNKTGARPLDTFGRLTAGVLALTLLAFFTQSITGVSTAWVAVGGAALLLAIHRRFGGPTAAVLRGVGWDVVIFVVGIFLVAHGLQAAGVTDLIGSTVVTALERGTGRAVFVTGLAAGGASAMLNNHPVAQIMALSIADLEIADGTRRTLAFAALVGGDLGPKMLPIGSLAALMWFRMLRDRGVEVPYRLYVMLGVPVTLAAMLAALSVLVLQVRLFG